MLNEKGLEAAAKAAYDKRHEGMRNCYAWDNPGIEIEHPGVKEGVREQIRAAITAYLSASAPEDVAGLVGRLLNAVEEATFGHESPTHVRALVAHVQEAASALARVAAETATLRARVAELEAKVERAGVAPTRFSPKEYKPGNCVDPDGEYVRFIDYASVRKELDKAQAEASTLRKEIEELRAKVERAGEVIAPFANCAIDKADFPLGEDYEAARRYIEEGK